MDKETTSFKLDDFRFGVFPSPGLLLLARLYYHHHNQQQSEYILQSARKLVHGERVVVEMGGAYGRDALGLAELVAVPRTNEKDEIICPKIYSIDSEDYSDSWKKLKSLYLSRGPFFSDTKNERAAILSNGTVSTIRTEKGRRIITDSINLVREDLGTTTFSASLRKRLGTTKAALVYGYNVLNSLDGNEIENHLNACRDILEPGGFVIHVFVDRKPTSNAGENGKKRTEESGSSPSELVASAIVSLDKEEWEHDIRQGTMPSKAYIQELHPFGRDHKLLVHSHIVYVLKLKKKRDEN